MSKRLVIGAVLAAMLAASPARAGVHATVTAYPVGDGWSWPVEVGSGDFDGDGITDLAVAGIWTGGGDFSILPGNGDGSFDAALVFGDSRFGSIAVADFDEDDLSDVALASDTGLGGVAVELNDGDQTFEESWLPTGPSASVATGDFDGDDHADLAAATPDGIALMLGDGDGNFSAPALYQTGTGGYSQLASGDFNADGRDDIVTAAGEGIGVLLGHADGTLGTPKTTALPACCISMLATGRLDGDARADVIVSFAFTQGVSVLIAGTDGTLSARATIPFQSGGQAAIGDADNDDRSDLVLASGRGVLALALGMGDGTFQPQLPLLGGAMFARPSVIDFNGDGYDDLAVGDYETNSVIVGINVPVVAASSDALAFGELGVGQMSAPRTVTLRNDGLPPLTVRTLSIGGAHASDFRITANTCAGRRLAAGEGCEVALVAAPAAGARSAQLVVDSTAAARSIPLSASGLAPAARDRDDIRPRISAKVPKQTLAAVKRRGLRATVGCSEPCSLDFRLRASAALARRLKLPAGRPLARVTTRLAAAGRRTVTLRLTRRARRVLRAATLTVAIRATDTAGNQATRALRVRLR